MTTPDQGAQPTTATTTPRTWLQATERQYADRLASFAAGLRRLADRIEMEGAPESVRQAAPDYLYAAQRAQHELMWGLANLSVESLTRAAAEVHEARAEESR